MNKQELASAQAACEAAGLSWEKVVELTFAENDSGLAENDSGLAQLESMLSALALDDWVLGNICGHGWAMLKADWCEIPKNVENIHQYFDFMPSIMEAVRVSFEEMQREMKCAHVWEVGTRGAWFDVPWQGATRRVWRDNNVRCGKCLVSKARDEWRTRRDTMTARERASNPASWEGASEQLWWSYLSRTLGDKMDRFGAHWVADGPDRRVLLNSRGQFLGAAESALDSNYMTWSLDGATDWQTNAKDLPMAKKLILEARG